MQSILEIAGFTTGLISPRLLGNTDFDGYAKSFKECVNRVIGIYGDVSVRPGFQYVAEAKDSSLFSGLVDFIYDDDITYVLEFSNTKIRIYKDRAQVLSGGTPYEITSPYMTADIPDLRVEQKFDKMFVTHENYFPREIARIADDNWTISEMELDEPAWLNVNDTGTVLTPSAVIGSVTFTASANTFVPTDVGRSIRYKAGPDDSSSYTYISLGATEKTFHIPFYPKDENSVEVFITDADGSSTEQTYNSGTLIAGEFKIVNGDVELFSAPGTDNRVIIQRKYTGSGEWGYATITAYTSATEVTATVVNKLGGTHPSLDWRLGAWSETTGYPAVSAFYQGRLWFAATTEGPDRLWGSEVENFYNFSPDNSLKKGQVDDSSPISVTLAGIKKIKFLKGINVMLLGGEGIYSIGKGGIAVTPPPIVLPEDGTLCSDVDPIVNENELIFTDKQRKEVYSAVFDFQTNGYKPTKLTRYTDDLFEGSPIAEMCMIKRPTPILIVRTEAGKLLSCTYDPEMGNPKWSKYEIAGDDPFVESLTCIPNDNKSEVWISVRRTVDSSTVRYIECMHNFFYLDDKADATFSDSYLTYDGAATGTLSGLDHLEGQEVEVLGDGGYMGVYTVSSGAIDMSPFTTEKATVGLNYDKYFITNPLNIGRAAGTTKGFFAAGRKVFIELYETDGLKSKFDGDSNEFVTTNFNTDALVDGQANPLFTGVKEVEMPSTIDRGVAVRVDQPLPLPQTVLRLTIFADIQQ